MAICPKCKNRFLASGPGVKKVGSVTEKQVLIICPKCQSHLKESFSLGFKIALYLALIGLIVGFTLFIFMKDASRQLLVYPPIIALMFLLWIVSPFFIKYEVAKEKDILSINFEKPWYQERMILHLCRRIVLLILLSWFLLEDGRTLSWLFINPLDNIIGLIAVFILSLLVAVIIISPII